MEFQQHRGSNALNMFNIQTKTILSSFLNLHEILINWIQLHLWDIIVAWLCISGFDKTFFFFPYEENLVLTEEVISVKSKERPLLKYLIFYFFLVFTTVHWHESFLNPSLSLMTSNCHNHTPTSWVFLEG